MELVPLGKSDMNITPVGLGAWAIGGEGVFGWGPQDDTESIAAIHRSVERGINWIDTAPVYGLGHSERIVARALRELGSGQRPLVFTKCSIVWDEEKNVTHSLKADSVKMEIEDSLRRLEVDVLGVLRRHLRRRGAARRRRRSGRRSPLREHPGRAPSHSRSGYGIAPSCGHRA